MTAPTRSHQIARELMLRNGRTTRLADAVVNVLLVLVIGITGAVALTHWGTCSQEVALCATLVTPTRMGWWRRLRWALVDACARLFDADDDAEPPHGPDTPPAATYNARHANTRLSQVLAAAWHDGRDAGERLGYTRGWRFGWFCGFALGVLAGSAALWLAFQLGLAAG